MCDIRFNAEKFRQLIDNSGLSINELSKKIGLDASLINRQYNGDKNRPISVFYLEKYCNYFNITPNYFYDIDDLLTDNEKGYIASEYTGLSNEAIKFLNQSTSDEGFLAFYDSATEFLDYLIKSLTENSRLITTIQELRSNTALYCELLTDIKNCSVKDESFYEKYVAIDDLFDMINGFKYYIIECIGRVLNDFAMSDMPGKTVKDLKELENAFYTLKEQFFNRNNNGDTND